jgi:hypothetical protein
MARKRSPRRKTTRKRKATPAQLRALRKARAMKAVRARARKARGGRGLIRNRPAARKVLARR